MVVKLSHTLHDKGNKPEQTYQTAMLTLQGIYRHLQQRIEI